MKKINRVKYQLAHNTSSLYRLNYSINDTHIYMKRDDILDFAFGGNKVRLFEYIIPMIIEKRATKIITFGSIHSNHIRVAAAVASILGIECDLIVLRNGNEEVAKGNGCLIHKYGANIVYCNTKDAHQFIDDYLKNQNLRNINYFWIPGGAHISEAIFGYVEAAEEILEQSKALNIKIDGIFMPCGTGTSQAGMLYGVEDKIPVYGISVARSVERCKEEILNLLVNVDKNEQKLEKDNRWEKYIRVIDNNIMYGMQISGDKANVASELVKTDGIILDPIYNEKTFCRMVQYLKEHKRFKNVIYINTGGTPNTFS